jgi:RND family efflux transporter MFP subunit
MTRKWITALGGALAALTLAITVAVMLGRPASGRAPASSQRDAEPIAVEVETVQRRSTPLVEEVSGTVQARLVANVASKVMGRVMQVAVREGDTVQAGQPVVWLESRDLSASVDQAEAAARASKVGVTSAAVAARMERAASEARIEAARAMVAQAESALKSAQARRDLVRTGPRKQERAQAALAVAQAKAALELAVADHDRARMLNQDGAVSKQQLDAAKMHMDVARAQYEQAVQAQSMADEGSRTEDLRAADEAVRQAEAALDMARQSLRQSQAAALMAEVRAQEVRTAGAQVKQSEAAVRGARIMHDMAIVRAPFDGIVARRLVDPGTMASPGMPLLVIMGGGMRFEAAVPEKLLAAVRVGTPAEVLLDAAPSRPVSGSVVEVTPQGDPGTHTFLVRVALGEGSLVRAGMFGRARFREGATTAITVPADAVIEREGLHYVYVVDADRRARIRLVTIGHSASGQVNVLSGLNPGERIVAHGVSRLSDGVRVRF